MLHNTIVIGAIGGFLGALAADLHAYSGSADEANFNWKKAAARWLYGAITGGMGAAGIAAVS